MLPSGASAPQEPTLTEDATVNVPIPPGNESEYVKAAREQTAQHRHIPDLAFLLRLPALDEHQAAEVLRYALELETALRVIRDAGLDLWAIEEIAERALGAPK